CNNINIGYSQSDRYDIRVKGVNTLTPTNCDCSALVRAIIKEATGADPGDFHTGNESAVLMKTGLFNKLTYYEGSELYEGDVLVTKTKGHTVIVVFGKSR
nr:hypothetical protein [Lachnospiraceae bacterium]